MREKEPMQTRYGWICTALLSHQKREGRGQEDTASNSLENWLIRK